MKKEFYIGQPLIVKETGEKVTFVYDDGGVWKPCNVLGDSGENCKEYHELEPSTEFKFSQIIAGWEQGYFEVGTEFRILGTDTTVKVKQCGNGLYLERLSGLFFLSSRETNSTWGSSRTSQRNDSRRNRS